jgi:two-component system response regulator AtoC
MAGRILLVDDDSQVRISLSEALEDFGFDVSVVESAEGALSVFSALKPELVLSDIRMPGLDGIELLKLLREREPDVDVVLMTAFDDMPTVVSAMREGAFDFLVKPVNLDELEEVLKRALADHRTRERARREVEDQARSYQLNELVGRDARMIQVFKLVGQLAATRVNVLIRGESGTGKEVVARAIHFNSTWAGEPFIPVNCTALPETLLESELFGHVKGSFTGAMQDRRGRFALAGKGTVFLDEIGDTGPEFQAKILRVLEDGEVYPVGGERPEPIDARVVAATHRDLENLVKEGTFREDLYYRLRVAQVEIPALRERPGDLSLLADHLIGKAARRLHLQPPTLSKEAREALLGHSWPGNVRELENCLTRAMALATGGVIREEHLGLGPPSGDSESVFRTMDEVEKEHVRRVLEGVGGNKAKAARVLGMSKPRLYRLIEKHDLQGGG